MMNWHSIRPAAMIVAAVLLSPLWSSGSSRADGTAHHDSLYVSDEFNNSVGQYDAETGAFIRILINGSAVGIFGPNGVVVDHLRPPDLVVANQNVNQPIDGDIRVFDEATGALESVLVPACLPGPTCPPSCFVAGGPCPSNPNAPFAPIGILLNSKACCSGELLVGDEGDYPVDEMPPGQITAFDAMDGTLLATFDATGYANAFHPYGMVVGPDGKLYVASRNTPADPARGDVLRFDLRTRKFIDVFVSGANCGCNLDHPSGVAFGPDGRLYVASSYNKTPADKRDTDKILVFEGATGRFVDKIDVDRPANEGKPRMAAFGILFGPEDRLYATVVGLDNSGNFNFVGSLRAYDIRTKQFRTIVRPGTPAANGGLSLPSLLTFGKTNPATLVYEDDDQYTE
jgi:hypothetical protein